MKKAQITVFVIMGMLILFALGLLVYFRGAVTSVAEQKPVDIQPVLSHVTHCLDMTATDALDLVGKQGGVVYKSQGGLTQDHPPKSVRFWYCIDSKEYEVYMDIVHTDDGCAYPRLYYPYDNDQCEGEERWKTRVGQSKLPPLYRKSGVRRGAHSIQAQLESYINNNLKNCLDFSVFKDFVIEYDNVSSTVLIAEKDVTVFIYFPINITGQTTKSYVDEFTIKEDIRLKKVYKFVSHIIREDTRDPRFDKNDQNAEGGTITSKVFWNIDGSDNLVWVQDVESLLKFRKAGVDEIYKFWFGVENRKPVLGCIPNKEYDACHDEPIVTVVQPTIPCPTDCCFGDPNCGCCGCNPDTYDIPSSDVIEVLPEWGWTVDDLFDKWCCPPTKNTPFTDTVRYYSEPDICDKARTTPCKCPQPCGPPPGPEMVKVNVFVKDEAGKFDCNDHEIKIMCECCLSCPPCP